MTFSYFLNAQVGQCSGALWLWRSKETGDFLRYLNVKTGSTMSAASSSSSASEREPFSVRCSTLRI